MGDEESIVGQLEQTNTATSEEIINCNSKNDAIFCITKTITINKPAPHPIPFNKSNQTKLPKEQIKK